jgi:hypothetical protein
MSSDEAARYAAASGEAGGVGLEASVGASALQLVSVLQLPFELRLALKSVPLRAR